MSQNKLILGLSAAVVFQIVVLAAEYGNAVYPLWSGREISLKTVPVDPRSLFRGNYARLRYEISEIPAAGINQESIPRNGEIVYVKLKAAANGVYSYDGASLKEPQQGMFIRGRIETYSSAYKAEKYEVEYGIEAFFAPKEKTLDLEKRLRTEGIAKIMLAGNGKAALKDVAAKKD